MPEAAASRKPARASGLLLSFDYGERRIGVAIGARSTGSARPVAAIANRAGAPDWNRIDALIQEWRPGALVVGRPAHADGSPHRLSTRIARFCSQAKSRYGLAVHLVDEAYTSEQARSELKAARTAGRRRPLRREAVDPLAAAILLESFLNSEHAH